MLASEFVVDGPTGYYRPVVLLSFWVDERLAPLLPAVYHARNLVLHAVGTALACLVLLALGLSPPAAALGAALFAVHPAHVESVAFVSGRTDLWATVFALGATLSWLRAGAAPAGRTRILAAVSGVLYLLASLSKEVAIPLPAVLLAWEALGPGGRSGLWRRSRPFLLAWGAALAAVLALRWLLVGTTLELDLLGGAHAPSRGLWGGAGPAGIVATYLRLLLVPWPLTAHYTPSLAALRPANLAAAAALAGWCAALAGAPAGRAGLRAALWIAAFLLPVAGFLPVSGAPVAERFLYLPSFGIALLAAATVDRLPRWRPAALAAGAALVALGLAGTLARVPVWKDELTLLESLVARSPVSAEAHLRLAEGLLAAGRREAGLAELAEAARLAPDRGDVRLRCGMELGTAGRPREALPHLARAVELLPGSASALNSLGCAYGNLGDLPRALGYLRQARALDPRGADYAANLALVLFRLGDRQGAQAELAALRHLDPGRARALEAAMGAGGPAAGVGSR